MLAEVPVTIENECVSNRFTCHGYRWVVQSIDTCAWGCDTTLLMPTCWACLSNVDLDRVCLAGQSAPAYNAEVVCLSQKYTTIHLTDTIDFLLLLDQTSF